MSFPSYYASSQSEVKHVDVKNIIDLAKVFTQTEITTPSQVYNTQSKQNELLSSLRQSKQIQIRPTNHPNAAALFEALSDLINKMFNNDKNNGLVVFDLIPNDVDIIKYEEGDFFGRHHDYSFIESTHSKLYSFLICIDNDNGAIEGGQTALYIDGTKRLFDDTTKPGGWLLFQNELDHEGLQVTKGRKIILKANVVAFPTINTTDMAPTLQNLVAARKSVHDEFMSKPSGSVLPVYTLSEYLFYRQYFSSYDNVIPFHFIDIGPSYFLEYENKVCKVAHFAIFNGIPIFSFEFVTRGLEEYEDRDDGDDGDDENDDDENCNRFRNLDVYDNMPGISVLVNEINRLFSLATAKLHEYDDVRSAFTIMQYCFWSTALDFSRQQENGAKEGFLSDSDTNSIPKLIEEKVQANMARISKAEKSIFALKPSPIALALRHDHPQRLQQIKNVFTVDVVNAIARECMTKGPTVHYSAGGSYHCNSADYVSYKVDLYFGFYKN